MSNFPPPSFKIYNPGAKPSCVKVDGCVWIESTCSTGSGCRVQGEKSRVYPADGTGSQGST